MFPSVSILVLFVAGIIQVSRARSLQLSVNLSLALNDNEQLQQQQEQQKLQQIQQQMYPSLSAEILRNCMRETEISMAELGRFRLSLLSNDADTVNGIQEPRNGVNATNLDYDSQMPMNDEHNEESLQCFAHCLYEKLGLIKDGVFMEPDFFRKFYMIVEREKQPVRECMNLESANNCETAYKMHLCYGKLKTLEAERRIREILEYNDTDITDDDNPNDDNYSVTTDLPDFDAADTKYNGIDKSKSEEKNKL